MQLILFFWQGVSLENNILQYILIGMLDFYLQLTYERMGTIGAIHLD